MKTFGKFILAISFGLGISISPASSQTDTDIISKIVKIEGYNGAPGTGFVLGPDKRRRCVLLTAKHTMFDHFLDRVPTFKIYLPDGNTKEINPNAFKFPVKDPKLDLALAPVSCNGMELSMPLAKSSAISITTPVKVFGYSSKKHSNDGYSGRGDILEGIVTKYSASGNDAKNRGYNISYSAKTFPGFSGGPVLSSDLSELIAVHGYTFSVQPDPNNENINKIIDFDLMSADDQREYLRVGGSGISASKVYRFLREHGYIMKRSKKAACLVGVC